MHDKTIIDESQSRMLDATRAGDGLSAILVILDGDDIKRRHKIDRRSIVIGRDVGCDVVLADEKGSRRHAELRREAGGAPTDTPRVTITDLGSTNGTFVNGESIETVELNEGDKILIGSTLFGYFVRDQAALKADESLIRLASVDALTGLANRGVFNVEIAREVDRARRYCRPLTLAMLDLDRFKKLNDTYGHQAGDQVLREIGRLVSINCRTNDVAARYGGEEFAIILPETPLENSLIQAERLRKAVEAQRFASGLENLQVTVSIGLAMLEPTMEDPADLIASADRALYRAKNNGRNQVCWNKKAEPSGDLREAG